MVLSVEVSVQSGHDKGIVVVTSCDDKDGHIAVDVTHGTTKVEVPRRWSGTDILDRRYALGALAYSLFDLVARESIKGQPWARIEKRPVSGTPSFGNGADKPGTTATLSGESCRHCQVRGHRPSGLVRLD